MKWVLIAIHISAWDGTVNQHLPLGSFDQQSDCFTERDRLQTSHYRPERQEYVCANEMIGDGKP